MMGNKLDDKAVDYGISLRDHFAAAALQGYLASWPAESAIARHAATIAQTAYQLADAMLAEREK